VFRLSEHVSEDELEKDSARGLDVFRLSKNVFEDNLDRDSVLGFEGKLFLGVFCVLIVIVYPLYFL
jgi:hypothetical protein